jgi:hypothetical protein
MAIADLVELLYGGGKPMIGTLLSVPECEAEAIIHFPHKRYRLVKDWILIDIQDGDSDQVLPELGLSPQIIYAANLLYDSEGRRSPGRWVRSTYRRSFTQGYLFESVNTVYVLMGRGVRKSACASTVFSIS